jgi:hypothetical protein
LGFLQSYFKDVYHNIFSRVDDYGIMRTYINSSKVIEVAKKYYNCPDVDGIELEDQVEEEQPALIGKQEYY